MDQFKKCKVVMLPTEKAVEGGIIKMDNNHLIVADRAYHGNKIFEVGVQASVYAGAYQPQHLYIISEDINESIIEGDYIYEKSLSDEFIHKIYLRNNRLCFFRFKNVPIYLDIKNHKARRIIASTDKELKLPKPSKNFIKKYIQKEGKIDFVNVQYTLFNYLDNKLFYLKTRKDNTIVTKHFQEENDNLIEHFEKDISNKENIIKIKEFNASFIEDILELSSKSYNLGFVNGKNSNSFPQVEKEFNKWFREKYFSNVKICFENMSENFLSICISYLKSNDEVICYNGTTGKFVEFSDSNKLKIDTSIGILEIHTLDIKYIIYK